MSNEQLGAYGLRLTAAVGLLGFAVLYVVVLPVLKLAVEALKRRVLR